VNIFTWLLSKWRDHQENKKWREFYARLDRNAEGKFTKAQYIRDTKAVEKAKRKQK